MARGFEANTVVDAQGNIEPNTQIEVRNLFTGVLADLFDAEVGGNAITNPFNADGNGEYSFWAESGAYLVTAGVAPAARTVPVYIIGDGEYALSDHTHDAADITSGQFADARVAESNVTQHEGALTITQSQISDLSTTSNSFEDMTALRAALDADSIPDGTRVTVYGETFEVDSALDDLPESWLYNVTGQTNHGLRALSPLPVNAYVYQSFLDQQNNKTFFHISADGLNWNNLNRRPIPRGAGNATVGARDWGLTWVPERNEWISLSTAGTGTPRDFAIWSVSPQLEVWNGIQDGFYGTTPGGIRDTILPGGEVPAAKIWGPRLRKYDGQWYIIFIAQYGASYTNSFGDNADHFRPFIAQVTDINTLATADPIQMDFPVAGHVATDPEASKLPPDIIKHPDDGFFYACIKNEFERNIDIYRSSSLTGTWTLLQTLDQDGGAVGVKDSLEGPFWQVHRYKQAPNLEMRVKHRIMVSDNRDENNRLVERYMYFEADDGPSGTYGPLEDLNFSIPTRNGSVLNLGIEEDPRAYRALQGAAAIYGVHGKSEILDSEGLIDGETLYPRDNVVYTFAGGGTNTITIEKTEAVRFFISNIDFAGGNLVISNASGVAIADEIPAGQNDLIEFRWDPSRAGGDGRYIRVGTKNTGTGGTADGVVNAATFDASAKDLTLSRTVGGDVVADMSGLPYAFSGTSLQLLSSLGTHIATVDAPDGTQAASLNLTPPVGNGTGIGFSTIIMAAESGPNIHTLKVVNNGTLVANNRDAGSVNRVYDAIGDTDLNPENGGTQFAALTAAKTFNLSGNLFQNGDAIKLDVINADTHALTITASDGLVLRWPGGTTPTFSAARIVIGIMRRGSNIYAAKLDF